MSKKQKLILTYEIRFDVLPVGANASMVHQFIRDAMMTQELALPQSHPMSQLQQDDFVVNLIEKRVKYA